MYILEVASAAQYLMDRGIIQSAAEVDVRILTGGVSNRVLQIRFHDPQREMWVMKQARRQLAVEQQWLCPVERVLREMDVLNICSEILMKADAPPGFQIQVPSILFEDRSNFVFAMTAMSEHGREWKQDLMHGIHDQQVAEAAGWILATLHCQTWMDSDVSAALGTVNFFDELRLDPYYRQVAVIHRDLEPAIQQLIVDLTAHQQCLVHGDFSPKNMLITDDRLMLLDFEVGHFGDPAFDLGFFLTHLVSKSVWDASHQSEYQVLTEIFCETYLTIMKAWVAEEMLVPLQQRACRHLGACLLARVDGKSPLEYLDHSSQQRIRKLGWQLLMDPPEQLARIWPTVTSSGQNQQKG